MRIICFVILWLFPAPTATILPLAAITPKPRIGCPDGLCYLQMFIKTYHERIIKNIGHFPSLFAISTIPKYYRRVARGKLKLIGNGLAHFEHDVHGFLIWEKIDEFMLEFHLADNHQLIHLSTNPPEGYEYINLFIPLRRNDVLTVLKQYPTLQQILNINPALRLDIKGTLWETEDNRFKMVLHLFEGNIWETVKLWGTI